MKTLRKIATVICLLFASVCAVLYIYLREPLLFGNLQDGNHKESIHRKEPKLPTASNVKDGKGDAEDLYRIFLSETTKGPVTKGANKSGRRKEAESVESPRTGADGRRNASTIRSVFMFGAGGSYTASTASSATHPPTNGAKMVLGINVPGWISPAKHVGPDPFRECAAPKCFLTQDRSHLQDAHAVLIFLPTMPDAPPQLLGVRRPPGQRWVAYNLEAPRTKFHFTRVLLDTQWKSAFDWSMSYRSDSDIFVPYGMLSVVDPPVNKNYTHLALSKEKGAAWFASNCVTVGRREEYVRRLQEHYPVDIYGKCGPLNCPITRSADCNRLLSRYRFYLAFENSLCTEYVTEKFFKIYDRNIDTIPVVRGGTDYKKYFPPGTFIDAADFASPKHLAQYLHKLDKDTEAYAAMLREKDKYLSKYVREKAMCKLCEKLHFDHEAKTYRNMHEWIVQGACKSPSDL